MTEERPPAVVLTNKALHDSYLSSLREDLRCVLRGCVAQNLEGKVNEIMLGLTTRAFGGRPPREELDGLPHQD